MTFDAVGAAWFILNISFRALTAAGAVALVLWLLGIRSAAVLHMAWSAMLFAMLLMPVFLTIVPALPIPVPAGAGGFLANEWVPSPAAVGYSTRRLDSTGAVPPARLSYRARTTDRPSASATVTASVRWFALVLLTVYLAGVFVFVARLIYGWTLAALLNRAIFWFHPLAWWLERKLTMTAEHACDEAAARAIAAPHRYAEILLEMADVVRHTRGRWQAVGVNGAGLLDSRIERLVCGDAFAGASRGKKITVGIACVLAIAMAIACRQQTPLREDPDLAKRLVYQKEQTKKFEAARDMTQQQADALEQHIVLEPGDFDTRRQLVTYYRTSTKVAWDKKVPGLRRHALWLVENHPEHDLQPPALSPEYDPEGFAAAKKIWEAHLARPDVSPFLVYRAVSFFAPHDKPYAEQLIRRGMAMDPDSSALKARMRPADAGYAWPSQLSFLYANALHDADKVNSAYALQVRTRLEATTDANLLARVGDILVRPEPPTKDPTMKQAQERIRALGIRYLERALELDPTLDSAKGTLVLIRLPERMTDADRLANRAHERYMIAEDITEYNKKDLVAGKAQRDKAKAAAEEALALAAAHPQDPAYSAAVMTAHHVLALAALRNGDRERAVHHLLESVKVPTSEHVQYAPPFSWLRPVHRLLKEGERKRVVQFLEAFARLTIRDRDRLLKDAQAVREGRMPSSYQHMVTREGY